MYQTTLLRKTKRKIAAAVVATIASLGVGALVIIAFLGHRVGTYSVTLSNERVELSLSEHSSGENPTTFLKLDYTPPFDPNTYGDEGGLLSWPQGFDSVFDNENVTLEDTRLVENDLTKYFKYTFFVCNTGPVPASYTISFRIIASQADWTDGTRRDLEDVVRFMVYENDGADPNAHNKTIYAKSKAAVGQNKDRSGELTNREFVYYKGDVTDSTVLQESDTYPLATAFKDTRNGLIADSEVPLIRPGETKRYTFVAWIEGSDPQATGSYPRDASMSLAADVYAREVKS